MSATTLLLFTTFILHSCFMHVHVNGAGCPIPPPTPVRLHPLMPRRSPRNPGPLSSRTSILFITQELKRNITFDPQNYTGSWVGTNYCLFKGFYCDVVPDKNITGLASVDFNGARFRGNLNFYRFISFLPDVALFHANSNNFSGIISTSINKLRWFFELDLSNNGFRGPFPVAVLCATQLTFVDVRFNVFTGGAPRQLFDLDVDVLFSNNNQLSQRIPTSFGNTRALYITLANNKFTGLIPSSIGQTSKTLIEILLLNNQLSGCLPYEIGFLNRSTVFDVGSNQLTGPIPASFGCLARMQLFSLAHNQFYGTIPESLCRLPNVYNFTLSYNYFTQVGTQCRRLIRMGKLDVRRNCISGLPNQRTAAECATFFSVPRSCPLQSTFSIVPCTLPAALPTSLLASEVVSPAPAPAPVTYAALVKPPH